jgi:hypothetical protein
MFYFDAMPRWQMDWQKSVEKNENQILYLTIIMAVFASIEFFMSIFSITKDFLKSILSTIPLSIILILIYYLMMPESEYIIYGLAFIIFLEAIGIIYLNSRKM